MIDSVLLYLESKVNCLKNKLSTVEAERDALQAKLKQLESALEEERQENASLRSGDDYLRGAE